VIAPAIFGKPVLVPTPAEYVALGAARQAAWTLSQSDSAPGWSFGITTMFTGAPTPEVVDQYRSAQPLTLGRN
jgi:xylulokinase